ncbi:MAG: hypothetical protein JSW47_14865, partial [Phycisphaerales bacterium]
PSTSLKTSVEISAVEFGLDSLDYRFSILHSKERQRSRTGLPHIPSLIFRVLEAKNADVDNFLAIFLFFSLTVLTSVRYYDLTYVRGDLL